MLGTRIHAVKPRARSLDEIPQRNCPARNGRSGCRTAWTLAAAALLSSPRREHAQASCAATAARRSRSRLAMNVSGAVSVAGSTLASSSDCALKYPS